MLRDHFFFLPRNHFNTIIILVLVVFYRLFRLFSHRNDLKYIHVNDRQKELGLKKENSKSKINTLVTKINSNVPLSRMEF